MTIAIPGIPKGQSDRGSKNWRAVSSRARKWRGGASVAVMAGGAVDMVADRDVLVAVTLTRVYAAPKRVIGHENWIIVAKPIRDGVADALFAACRRHATKPCGAYHDDDERITWVYEQRKGERDAVELRVECRGEGEA